MAYYCIIGQPNSFSYLASMIRCETENYFCYILTKIYVVGILNWPLNETKKHTFKLIDKGKFTITTII